MTAIQRLKNWMELSPRTFAETKKMIHHLAENDMDERWISIHDRSQPLRKDTDCLVLFETGEIKRYYEDYLRNAVITHWMPIPKIK
jgi:hypothetical protein